MAGEAVRHTATVLEPACRYLPGLYLMKLIGEEMVADVLDRHPLGHYTR